MDISDVLLGGMLLWLGYRLLENWDAMRSLDGKKAIRYPLYEEQDDKVVFYPRGKYSFLEYTLVFAFTIIIIIDTIPTTFDLSGHLALSVLLPIVILIVYAALWFYHSFERVEIDKNGVIRKYDFMHRDDPITIDNSNSRISKVMLGKHRVRYFLCHQEERILIFDRAGELFGLTLDERAEKLLTTILPKYGISNPRFINGHADSVI